MGFKASERYLFGFVDPRAVYATGILDLRGLSATIFKTEAEQRGWDMTLFAQTCPQGCYRSYGIIGHFPRNQ